MHKLCEVKVTDSRVSEVAAVFDPIRHTQTVLTDRAMQKPSGKNRNSPQHLITKIHFFLFIFLTAWRFFAFSTETSTLTVDYKTELAAMSSASVAVFLSNRFCSQSDLTMDRLTILVHTPVVAAGCCSMRACQQACLHTSLNLRHAVINLSSS